MIRLEKTLRNRIPAAVAALVLGVAPISSAMAFSNAHVRPAPYAAEWTGSLAGPAAPIYRGCPMNSAAEGNANQQNFPVLQYGQTSGGNRC